MAESESDADPTARDAVAMVRDVLGVEVGAIDRFPTGLCHFVFDVALADGGRVVARVSRPDAIAAAAGAVYWSDLLRPKGVPLPKLLHADLTMARHPFPFVLLERLPGRDLDNVMGRLTRNELRELASRLSAIQAIVAALPRGTGFGFAASYRDRFPRPAWGGVVAAELARSRPRIRVGNVFSERCVDRVAVAAQGLAGYFAAVAPTPFLHDITTKNVIVDQGRLSGIVDVDDVCFGDPLFLVGLLRMALLARNDDLTYADAWVEILRLDEVQAAVLDFYTALFCVNFMGELGQRFNRPTPPPVDPAYAARLGEVLDRYLQS